MGECTLCSSRGQASVELLIVLGAVFVLILFFIVFASNLLSDMDTQQDNRDATLAVQSLADAAEFVFAQGDGTKKLVAVKIPYAVVFNSTKTFIGRPQGSAPGTTSTMISMFLHNSNVFALTTVPLVGAFPQSPGVHYINVTSHGTFVSIGQELVAVSPSSINFAMNREETRSATATFDIGSIDPVMVDLVPDWPYDSITLSVSPSSFYGSNVSVPVLFTFTTPSNAGGIYPAAVNVTATQAGSSFSETLSIPISLEVRAG